MRKGWSSMLQNENNDDKTPLCPEVVPEEQTGVTEEERMWALKKEPRPPVPRFVFALAALAVLIAFIGGGFWYYRKNVLPEEYYKDASSLFKQERYAEALPLYEKVLKLRPERKGVLYQIAFCLEKTGRIDEAIARYEEHLAIMPGDGKAMLRAGLLYAEKGDYEKGLPMLKKSAERTKDPEVWQELCNAALKAGDRDLAVEALVKQAELFKDPEKVLAASKSLMDLKAWEEALFGYNRFTKIAPDDRRGIHGANAAKAMLGYPTDTNLIVVPGKSIGKVRLGASKEDVRAALGRPDIKRFTQVSDGSDIQGAAAEIWVYDKSMPKRGLSIIFIGGKVREVVSSSSAYKTEDGLGLSNFLLAKNARKFESRETTKNGAVICTIKGGGLTFYASGLTSDGTDAKYKKLRLHKADSLLSNIVGFGIFDLFK